MTDDPNDLDLLYAARDRVSRHWPANVEFLCSPAIGEYAITDLVPRLTDEAEELRRMVDERDAVIDELRARIAALSMPSGMEGW